MPSPRTSRSIVFYTHEVYDADQASRQSGATFSTNPVDDWTANLKDTVDTFGAGQTVEFLADKLHFDLSASYSKAAGSSFLFFPAGGTPNLAVNYTDPLDTTTWWTVQSSFKWKMMKSLSAVLGYWFEAVHARRHRPERDRRGLRGRGAIFLGALEPGYRYHVGSVRLVYSW